MCGLGCGSEKECLRETREIERVISERGVYCELKREGVDYREA